MSKVMNDAERNHGVTCRFLIYAPIYARRGLLLPIEKMSRVQCLPRRKCL